VAGIREAVATDLVAAAAEARRDGMVSAGLDVIRSRMAAYQDADPALLEDLRRHISAHDDLWCAVLRRIDRLIAIRLTEASSR
jgi:hypothetical protein